MSVESWTFAPSEDEDEDEDEFGCGRRPRYELPGNPADAGWPQRCPPRPVLSLPVAAAGPITGLAQVRLLGRREKKCPVTMGTDGAFEDGGPHKKPVARASGGPAQGHCVPSSRVRSLCRHRRERHPAQTEGALAMAPVLVRGIDDRVIDGARARGRLETTRTIYDSLYLSLVVYKGQNRDR